MSTLRALRRSTQLLRAATRAQPLLTSTARNVKPQTLNTSLPRYLSTTANLRIGLTEASDTKETEPAKESEPHEAPPSEPTPLTDEEYNDRSTMYLDSLFEKLEAAAEEKGGFDVEFAVCVPFLQLQ